MGTGDFLAQTVLEKTKVSQLDYMRTIKFFSIGFFIAVSMGLFSWLAVNRQTNNVEYLRIVHRVLDFGSGMVCSINALQPKRRWVAPCKKYSSINSYSRQSSWPRCYRWSVIRSIMTWKRSKTKCATTMWIYWHRTMPCGHGCSWSISVSCHWTIRCCWRNRWPFCGIFTFRGEPICANGPQQPHRLQFL